MSDQEAKELLDVIVGQVFGYQNPLSLEAAITKFAFDVRLPQEIFDSITQEPLWSASPNQKKFLSVKEIKQRYGASEGLQADRSLNSLEEIVSAWNEINYSTASREIDSSNVGQSDGVYHSKNVYRSVDVRKSQNILFSDGVDMCDSVVAGQTSKSTKFSIRVEDSKNISTSFNVIWSNKITNSFFIQDCFNLIDCMFCSHLANKQYCVANVQLTKDEYMSLKDKVVRWILQS